MIIVVAIVIDEQKVVICIQRNIVFYFDDNQLGIFFRCLLQRGVSIKVFLVTLVLLDFRNKFYLMNLFDTLGLNL